MRMCVIPARGGSKRIPRKNIRLFSGKPMIYWPIQAAKESGCFDYIMVSTDDDEIADVSKECGADVPFKRPIEIADDRSGTLDVLRHAVQWANDHLCRPIDEVCCLYATAAFATPKELRSGLCLLESNGEQDHVVFTASEYPTPIERAFRQKGGKAIMLASSNAQTRTQDLEKSYYDCGQFYWARSNRWLSSSSLFTDCSFIEIPRWRAHDIDEESDWQFAEMIFKASAASISGN